MMAKWAHACMVTDNTELPPTQFIQEPQAAATEQHSDQHSVSLDDINEHLSSPQAFETTFTDIIFKSTRRLPPSVYFNDGRRLIDFVLIYRTDKHAKQDAEQYRTAFEAKMCTAGLELEHEAAEGDPNRVYVKVHTSCTALKHRVCQMKHPFYSVLK
jgi:hypothetical protein